MLGQGQRVTAAEMLRTEAGMARKGNREGMKIWEKGLDLIFSPLPAMGGCFGCAAVCPQRCSWRPEDLRYRDLCCLLRLNEA